jgi:hypothetical protein
MTALADVDLPGSRFVARALVELGRPTIDRAWAYITGWAALERAQVPAKLRRELLARKFVATETSALVEMRRWSTSGSRAPHVQCAGMGVGKSFAGATWLLDCWRRKRSIAWLSAPSLAKLPLDRDKKRDEDRGVAILADEERRALEVWALVIDDLGGGSLNSLLLSRLKGLLFEREAADRPTMLLLNASGADAEAGVARLIEPRLLDRMAAGGGGVVYLSDSASLRRSGSDEDDLPADGRGKAWHAATNLIDAIGCMDDRDGSSWAPGQSRPIIDPVFGGRLEAAFAQLPDWLGEAEAVCRIVGADVLKVQRLAFDLADQDLRLRGIMAFDPVTLDGGRGSVTSTFGFLDRLREDVSGDRKHDTSERERLRVDPDYLRRTGEIQSTGQMLGARPRPTSSKYAAELPDGARARLAAQGVTVRFSSALQEFEVRYKQSKAVEKIRDGGGRDRGDLEKKHGRLLGTAMSEREAWGLAFEIMGTNALTGTMATG